MAWRWGGRRTDTQNGRIRDLFRTSSIVKILPQGFQQRWIIKIPIHSSHIFTAKISKAKFTIFCHFSKIAILVIEQAIADENSVWDHILILSCLIRGLEFIHSPKSFGLRAGFIIHLC